MSQVSIRINDTCISVDKNYTILEAARAAGIGIPTLCHISGLHNGAVCRICVVENGNGVLLTACDTRVLDGMEIYTNTAKVKAFRRMSLELMCENHRVSCDTCGRYTDCEFHNLCVQNGINTDNYETFGTTVNVDISRPITWDKSRCLLCRRCVCACKQQGLSLISPLNRGSKVEIGLALPLENSDCIGCGQCVSVCPTGALMPSDSTAAVWKQLLKKRRPLVAIMTTTASKMLGEAYHDGIGCSNDGKAPTILRKIGFDKVYDANHFSGDYDFALNKKASEIGTAISAACPGIYMYIEKKASHLKTYFPDAKTPIEAIIDAVHDELGSCNIVFIGSCTAVKTLASELGLCAALTVPEIASVIDRACVSRASALQVWRESKSTGFDTLGCEQVTTANFQITEIKGLGIFREIAIDEKAPCGIIKATACPGGCINGGGQCRLTSKELSEQLYLHRKC